jgi:hypothetical protein
LDDARLIVTTMLPPSVGTFTRAEVADAVSRTASPMTFVAGTRAGSVWASPVARVEVTKGCMPRVHSCCDLPDELQARAKSVATRVTDSLPCPPEAADVGSVGLPGTGVGTVDDQAVSGSDGCEDAGLTVTNGA